MVKRRRLPYSAGVLTILSSLLGIAFFGLYFVFIGGYTLVILTFFSSLGAKVSDGMGEIGAIFGLLGSMFLVPTIVSIVGLVFGSKLVRMSRTQDYYYQQEKKRLITYVVFLLLFAVVMVVYGVFFLLSGASASSTGDGMEGIIMQMPSGLIIGPAYLLSAILIIIDLAKNKVFKKGFEAPVPEVTKEQAAFQPQFQPYVQQPQIITLKPGEELPEHLKGRVVPVAPTQVAEIEKVKAQTEAPKPEEPKNDLEQDLAKLKEMLDNKLISEEEYETLKKNREKKQLKEKS